jgi:hypothetical protein
MAQAGALVAVHAGLVRTPVPKHTSHRGKLVNAGRLEAVSEGNYPGDATH